VWRVDRLASSPAWSGASATSTPPKRSPRTPSSPPSRSGGAQRIPDNPAAWLNTTARFLAVDRVRRRDTERNKYQQVAATQAADVEVEVESRSSRGRRDLAATSSG